jgi:hypothetical protein
VIAKIREWKSSEGISLNAPIKKVTLSSNRIENFEVSRDIIQSTLNITTLDITTAFPTFTEKITIKPDFSKIGKKFRDRTPEILTAINKKKPQDIAQEIKIHDTFNLLIPSGTTKKILSLPGDFLIINTVLQGTKENMGVIKHGDILITLEK